MEQVLQTAYALDTFYLLICGALVMWMAAGFTMLEAGLVRAKNTAEILTKNVGLFSIACIMYLLVGYNLMYPGDDVFNSVIPKLKFLLGADNSVESITAGDGATYSNLADFFFQVVFVATAMSIVSGAVAERMKLWAFLAFAVVMCGLIYPIQGYWKWGGGFLDGLGFSDFAGSGVVHMTGAAAALAGVLLLGARKGKYSKDGKVQPIPGCNLPLATVGMFILWLGWFGFNGGSQLKVSDVENANAVAMVFVNTNMAAACGLTAALLLARFMFGKADLTMALNGALAGLVAITAAPDSPSPGLACVIGAIGGALVVFSIVGLDKLKIDDPVGAISVHGTVGIWGLLAVPLSTDTSITSQLIGIVAIFAWVFAVSFVTWMVIKMIMGIRVSDEDEESGVDWSECGLAAYPEFAND